MKLPVASYSLLNDFINCPYKAFRKYIAKDVPYEKTAATEHGNAGHDAMDKRISAGVPLPADFARFERWAAPFDGKRVETEIRLGCRADGSPCGFYDEDCYVHGKADLIVTPGDHTLRMFDWKWGNVREEPFELRVNAAMAQARDPEVRQIRGWYAWMKEGPDGKLGMPHDLSDVERTWAEIDSIIHTMGNYAAINHWPKKENPLCKWCPAKDCQYNRNKGNG